MKVSRVQLQGFKSFSGRAELELGPGITAVVGPNGSGKSNLVDAIRLVLGETSARELRGQRLEQMIFAGSQDRAPLGMAEVTLVFDNQDGRLPVEDVEVAISRRVFRDGTTEFRRNGQRLRLRDLGRLLDATGLAQAGYAVIAQNDIESIIRASPAQRRHLVEEAAGVRGAQALLDDADARLRSLGDWLDGTLGRLAELLPRIESLRQEAAAAEEAGTLRQRLNRLRGGLERGRWLSALSQLTQLERQLHAGERRLDQLRQRAQEFQGTYAEGRARLEALQEERISSEREAGKLALVAQQASAQEELWGERAVQAAGARAEALEALAQAEEDLQSVPQPAGAALPEGPAPERDREQLARLEREASQQRQERERCRRELTQAREEERLADRRLSDCRRRRSELEGRRAAAEAWQAEARATEEAAASARASSEQTLREVTETARQVRQAASREATALERAERQEAQQLQALGRAEETLSRATVSLREAEARLGAQVVALEADTQAAPIAAAATQGRIALQRLSEGVRSLQAADAAAAEAGLGSALKALVGEERVAQRALELAGDPAELVCWPVGEPALVANPPSGCRPLASALEGDARVLRVVAQVARLVCLAEDREAARRWLARFPEGRAVLADGTVLGTGLEITPSRAQGELRLVEQLRDAERLVQRWREELAQSRQRVERARSAHLEQRQEVDRRRRQASSEEAAVQSQEAQLARLRQEAGEAQEQIESLRRQAQERQAESAAAEVALSALEQDQSLAESHQLTTAARSASAHEAEVAAAEAVTLAAATLEEARLASAKAETESRSWRLRAEEQERRRHQLEQRREGARGRIRSAEHAAASALVELAGARERAREAARAARLGRERLEQDRGPGHDPLQELGQLERSRGALETGVAAAEAQVQALRREVATQAQEVEVRRNAVGDGATAEVAPGTEAAAEADPGRTAAEITRLERRLATLGPVNELAPEELQSLLERTETLRLAHGDCVSARDDLGLLGASLRRASGARFRLTFDQVAREFKDVWRELFGGGRAELSANPAEEGAQEGVEMVVQPPGKRAVPMALLSGGERALTALALVLALQQVAPSPFYVFDEVDAALDEVNILHFADLLQRRAQKSQFLVVTHSLTTMARAGNLYGVTQDGAGSSRLLSVRLAAEAEGQATEPALAASSIGA